LIWLKGFAVHLVFIRLRMPIFAGRITSLTLRIRTAEHEASQLRMKRLSPRD
jgi:hypothetical protein